MSIRRKRKRLLRAAALSAAIFAAAGCGPRGDIEPIIEQSEACLKEPPPADGAEAVILGKSQGEVFMPLAPDDVLTLNFGPQGGQHIYASVMLFAKTAGTWYHSFEVVDRSTSMKAGGSLTVAAACASQWTVSHNVTVFVDDKSIEQATLKLMTSLDNDLSGTELLAEMPILIE